MGDVTLLLKRAREGDSSAWDQAVALVYADLKHIARGVLGGRSQQSFNATSLVHECYLRMERAGAGAVMNRQHFLALAARAMRQLMLNHARDRVAEKRGGLARQTTLSHADEAAEADQQADDLIALNAALERLGETDSVAVSVIECRVFSGMTDEETAAALALPLRSMQRIQANAKARLSELLADTAPAPGSKPDVVR
jgi:RNA polymerase sigma factor (TIGR02999 family)